MDSVRHLSGHGLTLKDSLQGQMSVGYTGYIIIYLFKKLIMQRFYFLWMGKSL